MGTRSPAGVRDRKPRRARMRARARGRLLLWPGPATGASGHSTSMVATPAFNIISHRSRHILLHIHRACMYRLPYPLPTHDVCAISHDILTSQPLASCGAALSPPAEPMPTPCIVISVKLYRATQIFLTHVIYLRWEYLARPFQKPYPAIRLSTHGSESTLHGKRGTGRCVPASEHCST